MGIMGNVANTLLNPMKFMETANKYAGFAANAKNVSPSEVASNSNNFIISNTPGIKLLNSGISGLSSNGISGAIYNTVNSGKDMLNKSGIIDLISPQRNEITSSIDKLTNSSVANLGEYLKSQHRDFGRISNAWNKLTPGSKIALAGIGIGTALWGGKFLNEGIDKLNKRVNDKLHPETSNSTIKAAIPENLSFDTEFLKDNKGIADRYKANSANYISADGKTLDVASYNRAQELLNKQFDNEFNNYKEFMKRSDPIRYNKIKKSEALAKSVNVNDSMSRFSNSLSKIPKPLLYGGAAIGGTYVIKNLMGDKRR